ncbi:MAG: hypothetical protein LBV23_02285 [Deltaproteobacteria bacterium]|jgi:DNA-directed RNA polymerase subunit RPC12/RpoP|nr:hypothetical protein [Deltaproteobacteria bacterium]
MESLSHIGCPSCGADLEVVQGRDNLVCPYCGSEVSLVESKPVEAIEYQFVSPMRIDAATLRSLCHQKMAECENVPDDFLSNSHFETLSLFFVPCWLGKGSFKCNWTASFGFDRQEPYTDYVSKADQRGTVKQVKVTKFRTVTDWRPVNGQASDRFSRLYVPAQNIPVPVASMLESSFPVDTLQSFSPYLLAGFESGDLTSNVQEAEKYITEFVETKEAVEACRKHAQGDRQRDWHFDVEVTFELPPQAGFLPLGHSIFLYRGKQYNLWADGADATLYIADEFPVDVERIKKKRLSFIPLAITILVASLLAICLSLKIVYLSALIVGLSIPLAFGLGRLFCINNFSKKVKTAALAAKKLETSDSSGSPLNDEQRLNLYNQSQPPKKPLLAKTHKDVSLLALISFISVLFATLSFGQGLALNKLWLPRAAAPNEETELWISKSPSSLGRRAQSGANDVVVLENGTQAFDLYFLRCSGQPPDSCLKANNYPVTGLVFGRASPEALNFLGQYLGGRLQGLMLTFNSRGQIRKSQNYIEGRAEGLQLIFTEPESEFQEQSLLEIGYMRDNLPNGIFLRFDDHGRPESETPYVNGEISGLLYRFYDDGSVRTVQSYENGRPVNRPVDYRRGENRHKPDVASYNRELKKTLAEVDALEQSAKEIRYSPEAR